MDCHICLKSNNLIRSCQCSIQVHQECIEHWYHIFSYGKVIRKGNLLCPQCKSVGNVTYFNTFKEQSELDSLIHTLIEDPKWTYILCGSCKKPKRYMEETCLQHINEDFSLICSDCSPNQYKECPSCGILIERAEGCSHMTCICGIHWCWICREICEEMNIYNHIDKKHMNITERELLYEEYLENVENLSEIPREFWTEELILKKIENISDNFKLVINKDYAFIIKALEINPYILEFIEEQTPELCLVAVKKTGYALKFIEEQTPELCLVAVKQTGYALKFVEEQTPELCLAAVQQNGYALQYVQQQTYEICLIAVQKNCNVLPYVKEQFMKLFLKK